MPISVLIWSICHQLSNGNLRSIILFASFGTYSLIDLILTRKSTEQVSSYPITKDALVIVIGLIMYSIILYFHQYVSGIQIVERNNFFFFLP